MKLMYLGVVAVVLAFSAMPAMAVTDVDDDSNPDGELDLYEIYDIIYGLDGGPDAHNSTTGTGLGDVSLRTDGLELTQDELFTFFSGTFSFRARFAGNTQEFGYYDPNNPNDRTVLAVITSSNGVVLVGGAEVVAPFSPSVNPFGFYDRSPHDSLNIYFSESSLNEGALEVDHMVAYWATESDGSISTTRFIIAFEDLPVGSADYDYNDLVIEIVMDPVPEPATAGLLLLGLGGMAIRRRFMA